MKVSEQKEGIADSIQRLLMHLTVRSKVAIGFTASVAVLVASAIVSNLSAQRLTQSIAAVTHTHQVLGELRDIENVANSIQASIRGYVITGDEEFLEPFRMVSKDAHKEVQDVLNLVRHSSEQCRRLEIIDGLFSEVLKTSDDLIGVRKSGGFEAAKARVAESKGKNVTRIRQIVEEMSDEEIKLLAQRSAQATESVWWTNLILLLGGALAVAIVATAVMLLLHHIKEREGLEQAILEISEREKQRFGRDVHDSLCQELAGIAFMSQVAERNISARSPADAAELARISGLAGKAIAHARSLARGLQPVEVESNGLMVALEELARTTEEVFRVPCKFVCTTSVLLNDNPVAVHLYRIAQEAVQNAIRHGEPKQIEICLASAEGGLCLEIQDDGKGIPAMPSICPGMGLKTMSYRASMINAHLKITRPPAGGTLVRCSLPSPEVSQIELSQVTSAPSAAS